MPFGNSRLQESVELRRRALGHELRPVVTPRSTGREKTATRLVFSEGDRPGGLSLIAMESIWSCSDSLAVAQRAGDNAR
ncbi:MAG: hypothetical protein U0894_00460 [Pirellulales bacterium]